MQLKYRLRALLRKTGFDLCRYTPTSHALARMQYLFVQNNINLVIDVGANKGQFGEMLRENIGYTKKIVSFEPLHSAFLALKEKVSNDPNWDAFNLAIGDTDESSEINIAANSFSSSLLDMLPSHENSAPESIYAGKELVHVRRLDSVFGDLCDERGSVYMKIDTQGFESKVLSGAEKSLGKIDVVQMEMSLVPLYKGELLFGELYDFMIAKEYKLVAIIPGFVDRSTGEILQMDGIFHRSKRDIGAPVM